MSVVYGLWIAYALWIGVNSVIVHDIIANDDGLYCLDGSQPLTMFSGNEQSGWITAFGCGYPPNIPTEPGGCKDREKYEKPIVTLNALPNGKWQAKIFCRGDQMEAVS